MSGIALNVNPATSAYVLPRPLITPAWICGDEQTFISADFTVDGLDTVHIVATLTAGHFTEEFQSIDCDLEDAENHASDLMSDARGTLYNNGVRVWEQGSLVRDVRDLVAKIQARKAAA